MPSELHLEEPAITLADLDSQLMNFVQQEQVKEYNDFFA